MISDINIFLEELFRNFAIPIMPNNLRSIQMSKGDEAIKIEHVEADTHLQFLESSDHMNVLPYVLSSHLLVILKVPAITDSVEYDFNQYIAMRRYFMLGLAMRAAAT